MNSNITNLLAEARKKYIEIFKDEIFTQKLRKNIKKFSQEELEYIKILKEKLTRTEKKYNFKQPRSFKRN